MLRPLPLFLLLVGLLLPGIALAGPTVIYGPGLDSAQAASRAKVELDTGDFAIAGALTALVGEPPESLALAGGAVSRCGNEDSGPIGGVVLSAGEEVVMMEYAAAAEQLDAAILNLPCGAVGATTDDLYSLLFLRGQSAFYAGDPETAHTAFSAAVVLDPKRPWDERLPPTMKDAYFAALQEVFDAEPLTLHVEAAGISVDGAQLSPGDKALLLPGRHIVALGEEVVALQVPRREERFSGLATTRGQLITGLTSGDSRYAPWLASVAAEQGWTEVVLVTEDALHRLEGEAFQGQRVQVTLAPQSVAGMATTGAGLAVMGVGLALHLEAWDSAKPQRSDDGTLKVGVEAGDDYDALVQRNHAGLAMAIGGGAAAGVGVVLAISGAVQQRQGLVADSAPWFTPLPEGGVALGIGGRF